VLNLIELTVELHYCLVNLRYVKEEKRKESELERFIIALIDRSIDRSIDGAFALLCFNYVRVVSYQIAIVMVHILGTQLDRSIDR
jgi:hypothetical protein